MLCIKTKLMVSKISGIGLFADEYIKKGTLIWKFEPSIDLLFTTEEVNKFPESFIKQFHNYAFLDKRHQKYMLCGDDGRFFNHSGNPNCDDESFNITTALRDIPKGEELTVNYFEFYGDLEKHPEIF